MAYRRTVRPSTLILAATSLVLAGSTSYFAWEFRAARDELANYRMEPSRPAGPSTGGELVSGPSTSKASTVNAPSKSPLDSADMHARSRAALVAEIPALRAQLEDPELRAKILRQLSPLFGGHSPGDFMRYVGLNDDEYARLLELLVDQKVEQLDANYQCALKPECDGISDFQTLVPEQDRKLAETLGADRKQRLDNYVDNTGERMAVTYLRGTLPDSQALSDAQAARLVDALGDERRRATKEIEQRGATIGFTSNLQGKIIFASTAEGIDQKFSEAQEYQRRLSERAGQILNSQQLSVFNKNQEDLLASTRRRWENEENQQNKP